jgi:HK97 family phage major capsid protein
MPDMRTTTLGNVEVRDVEGQPGHVQGMAVPYGVVIDVPYGRERFVRGAFEEMARSVNAGERVAYLNRHGADGGVPVAVINSLQERDAGLFYGGDVLDVPETPAYRSQVASGINGVSIEFVPGKFRRKGDVIEHYAGVRLAAIAGSYAPAYRQAHVALRSVARATERKPMPALSAAALTERRDTINRQIATIRQIAETEDRSLADDETTEISTLSARVTNVDALIVQAQAEEQRRDAERQSLPQQRAGSPAVVTRSETIYGPGREVSFFADLIGMHNRDAQATERMVRHHALVVDLAQQIERRAVDSGDLAGAYPTTYYPDLYVPDVAMTGPLSAFFATTPIAAPNPIVVPTFGTQTGDTAVQASENAAVANVDITTDPATLTPKTIGGESVVSRQAVDGASPGTDVIIGNQLRELLMRDTEREIALVLEALTSSGAITDTAGTTPAQSGADLHRGIAGILSKFYAGDAAGGANARFLPAEGTFLNSTDWNSLVAGEDGNGRPLLAYINPNNALGQQTAPGFQKGIIGGVPVEPAWAILSAINNFVARRNDARQWKSAVLDVRLMEREGPQSVVFAIWQYFGFAVLEPKGVRKYTYTNV